MRNTRMLLFIAAHVVAFLSVADNTAEIIRKRDALWQQAQTVSHSGDVDSAMVLTRQLIELTDENRWDDVSFDAHKFRAETRLADSVRYAWKVFSEFDYFRHYPKDGRRADEAELLGERLIDEYYALTAQMLDCELPEGLYVSEIHESDKELQSNKLVIGEKRHKDMPFFSFLILKNEDGGLEAKISSVCGVSRDLKAVDVYSGKFNNFILGTPLMKNDKGGYFFEISAQKVKNSHTSTANTLSTMGAEFNKTGRDAIDTAPAGNYGEKLVANASVAVISGLFELGASLARKGHVANQMVSVELYPKGNGRVKTVFKRVDYIVDQNNNEKTRVMSKVFDSFLLQPHHEVWLYEPDNSFLATHMGVTHPTDVDNMRSFTFYSSLPYIGKYDKRGKWKSADVTKLGRRSMAHLLASEYLSFLDDDDPALKYVPDLDNMLSFTIERDHYQEDSWQRALYKIYVGDYDAKEKWFKSFYIKRDGDTVVIHYSPDNWKTRYASIYNLFYNTVIRCEIITDGMTIENIEVVRDRTDGFSVMDDRIEDILF